MLVLLSLTSAYFSFSSVGVNRCLCRASAVLRHCRTLFRTSIPFGSPSPAGGFLFITVCLVLVGGSGKGYMFASVFCSVLTFGTIANKTLFFRIYTPESIYAQQHDNLTRCVLTLTDGVVAERPEAVKASKWAPVSYKWRVWWFYLFCGFRIAYKPWTM